MFTLDLSYLYPYFTEIQRDMFPKRIQVASHSKQSYLTELPLVGPKIIIIIIT